MNWSDLYAFVIENWLAVVFGCITAGLGAAYRHYVGRMRREKEEAKAIRDGVEALLADQMIQLLACCEENGYCSQETRERAESMYTVYRTLGGNGNIADIYDRILALPVAKPKES